MKLQKLTHAAALLAVFPIAPALHASQALLRQGCQGRASSYSAASSGSTSSISSGTSMATSSTVAPKLVSPSPTHQTSPSDFNIKLLEILPEHSRSRSAINFEEQEQLIRGQRYQKQYAPALANSKERTDDTPQLSAQQLFQIAEQFRTDTGTAKNDKLAIEYYCRAFQKKDLPSFRALCTYYLADETAQRFVDTTISQYRKLAEQGNTQAQVSLGLCYAEGLGVEKSLTTAAAFYQAAADQDHPIGLGNLANLYKDGRGVTKNLTKAFELYQRSAKIQRRATALSNLAGCYAETGGTQNYAKALELYEEALSLSTITNVTETILENLIKLCKLAGVKGARYLCNLGVRYWEGLGVKQNTAVAATLLTAAADQGIPEAQYNLGTGYQRRGAGSKEVANALYYFQKAADQKHPLAQQALGALYYEGTGVEKDQKKAFELFELAAAHNYALAEQSAGICCLYGDGTEKNIKKAVDYFVRAADHGLLDAQIITYTLFQRGICVAQDTQRAAVYFEKIKEAAGSEEMAYIILKECPNLEETFKETTEPQ